MMPTPDLKARAKLLLGEREHRGKAGILRRHQRLRLFGAKAGQIALGIGCNRRPRLGHRVGDAVDRRVGEARQRHIGGFDRLALP